MEYYSVKISDPNSAFKYTFGFKLIETLYKNKSPYGKKKNQQVIWRWKYTMNHCQGEKIHIRKKYILEKKKEKANLGIPIVKKKKSKDTQLVGQKKKLPFGLLSYNAKSAQY